MAPNPFKPTAGAFPPHLAGRGTVLAEFTEAMEDGPGAPGRLTVHTGTRGVGKTVIPAELGDLAAGRQWVALAETATPGLLTRLEANIAWEVNHRAAPAGRQRRIQGVTLPSVLGTGGGGVTFDPPLPQAAVGFRRAAGELLTLLEAEGAGLLFTVDEVHNAPRASLKDTIGDSGRHVAADALGEATNATSGYPFLVQSVGYHVWRHAAGGMIGATAARTGIATAHARLGTTVLATAIADLSTVDRRFLAAMADDDGPSTTLDVATRLGKTPGYVSKYRDRLIKAGMIEPAGHGRIAFTIPHLREYLRERHQREIPGTP
jgi:hypothetical protein